MANKTLFESLRHAVFGADRRPARTVPNEAGGHGFALSNQQQLAQLAATGCLSQTFYVSAENQLEQVLELCQDAEPEFLAQLAVYARQRGFMKDMPALLCAVLAARGSELLPRVFPRVIDNGRMLRTFVQILRSGATGRRSLGTMPKRLVRQWLEQRSDRQLVNASVGQSPSLRDIVRMVHPKPLTPSRSALYAWLCERQYVAADLPEAVRAMIAFQNGENQDRVPDVPFQLLTNLALTAEHWRTIARQAPWQMTRMNLNTFGRHGVFEDREMVGVIANRLRNPAAIRRAKVFPYQLMVAYTNTNTTVPTAVKSALQDAMEIATANTPVIAGTVHVCVDVSGSMHTSVTGHRQGQTSAVRCIDVAALFAACIMRNNPDAQVLPFSDSVLECVLNPRDAIMTNAEKLSSLPWGGTNCSAPLRELNRRRASGDTVVLVSDNESWLDKQHRWTTGTLKQWRLFRQRNPNARLVCLDIQPYRTVQAPPSAEILHVGGFSDQVFSVVRSFLETGGDNDHWVKQIEGVEL